MPRVVSIYLPDLPIERIRRMDQKAELSPDRPLVLIASSGSRRWISAADAKARQAGLRVGMPAAKAQAMVHGLQFADADPAADAVALERIALWSLSQYSPIVAVDGTDGIVMDTQGADHLQGGELAMLTRIANRFRARGLTVHAAIADTWGAAHACARATHREVVIIPLERPAVPSNGCRSRSCGYRRRSSPAFARSASKPSANCRRRRARH